ncbi:conidiation-specific protein [Paramyrothecium foliicola]|nr:conidiation-specific protein [Paramyrothecium foliicola]
MLLILTLLAPIAAVAHETMFDHRPDVDQLDKPAAWPSLDFLDASLNKLPKAPARISPWVSGNIPRDCRGLAISYKRDPTKFKSYSAFLGDCEIPWYFCVEDGAQNTIEQLVDKFARVPVVMRESVNAVLHVKDGMKPTSDGNYVTCFAGGPDVNNVRMWLHAITHGLFAHVRTPCSPKTTLADTSAKSDFGVQYASPSWKEAYGRDSHVPDPRARRNYKEDFAQFPGLILYDRFTNKHLQTFKQYDWIKHQIRVFAHLADELRVLDYSDKMRCKHRIASGPAVNPKTGAIVKRAYTPPRNPGIVIEPRSEGLVVPKTNNPQKD